MNSEMNQSKLSKQQKAILGWVYAFGRGPECKKSMGFEEGPAYSDRYCNRDGDKGSKYDVVRYCYTLSQTNGQRSTPTRSESASFSRSIKELWRRGLLGMYNTKWIQGYEAANRCTQVTIKPIAVDLGKSLVTKEMQEFVKARWSRWLNC